VTPQRGAVASGMCLAAVATAVALSREFARRTLRGWGLHSLIDDAELVVSELVTNAVKATGLPDRSRSQGTDAAQDTIEMKIRLLGAGFYVEVWDRNGGSPTVPAQTDDAEGGRGLFLVESLSDKWGVRHPAEGGKVVWARLLLATGPAAAPAEWGW
jgi:anti-sigma regulatory factor (Ser/Thr protein kinase)